MKFKGMERKGKRLKRDEKERGGGRDEGDLSDFKFCKFLK
jgi:hypothetical protein